MENFILTEIIGSLAMGDKLFRNITQLEPIIDSHGRLIFTAGRQSALVKARFRGEEYALKCYLRSLPHRQQLHHYIRHSTSEQTIIHPDLYTEELWVGDGWLDVALYKWVEGVTLDRAIRKALHDQNPEQLGQLLEEFTSLCKRVLAQEWRHGDLKTENIIVRPDGEMILVDCDALYVPNLATTTEIGTPHWIHPMRLANRDEHIDDYAIALIIVSLYALRADPSLFKGGCAVAMPSECNRESIDLLLRGNEPLRELHKALYAPSYIIEKLNDILECIAHK